MGSDHLRLARVSHNTAAWGAMPSKLLKCEADARTARRRPQIFGLYIVKLAMALMVVGGVPRCDESGTHIRGEIHMLLVGDPGTGACGARFCRSSFALVTCCAKADRAAGTVHVRRCDHLCES